MKTPGNQRKLAWLRDRLAEGLRMKILGQGERGYIEYLPGAHAWRPVIAGDYMFIHCLWIVGKSKGQGFGQLLLKECEKDAAEAGLAGVAAVVSQGVWLMNKKLLEKNGYESVDQAPPSFDLMVKRFRDAPGPSFTGDWEAKAAAYPDPLTVVRTDQCPYNDDAVDLFRKAGAANGLETTVVELLSADDIRSKAPSAYGVFNVVRHGRLFCYHYLTEKEFSKRLAAFD